MRAQTRKIGATVLYKANTESPIFKKLSELALEIASKPHEVHTEAATRA